VCSCPNTRVSDVPHASDGRCLASNERPETKPSPPTTIDSLFANSVLGALRPTTDGNDTAERGRISRYQTRGRPVGSRCETGRQHAVNTRVTVKRHHFVRSGCFSVQQQQCARVHGVRCVNVVFRLASVRVRLFFTFTTHGRQRRIIFYQYRFPFLRTYNVFNLNGTIFTGEKQYVSVIFPRVIA